MKNITIITVLLLSFIFQAYADLDPSVIEEFKKNPTLEQLEVIKQGAQEMIQKDQRDHRGYSYLSQAYLASRKIIGDVDAYEKSIEVMNQYMELDDFPGKVDFSEFLSFTIPQLESVKKEAQRREREGETARRMALPEMETVKEARMLIPSPLKADLDRAEELLDGVISLDPTFWEAYVELSNLHRKKTQYEKAFAAWRLAVHFGDRTDIYLLNCTVKLRYVAMNYEVNNDVTPENPGASSGKFFIWLNRDLIASYLPEKRKADIEEKTMSSKAWRAEKLKTLKNQKTE